MSYLFTYQWGCSGTKLVVVHFGCSIFISDVYCTLEAEYYSKKFIETYKSLRHHTQSAATITPHLYKTQRSIHIYLLVGFECDQLFCGSYWTLKFSFLQSIVRWKQHVRFLLYILTLEPTATATGNDIT